MLSLGKTIAVDFHYSEDVELVLTIPGYLGVALDNAQLYSSLEQKAQQIERLKDFAENIVESMNVGVLAVDFEGRIEFWNTQLEHSIGVRRADAVGRAIEEILPADLAVEIAARSEEERVTNLYKFPLRNRDGRTLVVNVSIAPLAGESAERLGRLILVDDITQRMQLEEQLLQTEKLTSLGLLAAGVAHEVNTPLAVISNYIQMLAKQLPANDPRHKLTDKIVKQTFRASEIVNNLLSFSRTGGTELGPSVSYGIIKEHAGKIEVRSTPGKGTSFRLEFPAARKAVHA